MTLDRRMRTERLRLWIVRRLLPRGYGLHRKTIMGVPPEVLVRRGR